MNSKRCITLSLLPLKPVKSGMQNTTFLLEKFLKEKGSKNKFINLKSINKIDPVINLKFDNHTSNKIMEEIINLNPDYIFVNTSKLLYVYKDILLKKNRKFKTILVCHDLYYFRNKYFRKIKIKDRTALSINSELGILKKSDYIIDISPEEKNYLIKKKIKKKKIISTLTPIQISKKPKFSYKFDFVYTGSNWYQNSISFDYLYKQIISKVSDKNVLVMGMKKNKKFSKNVIFKSYNKKFLFNCKFGLAFLKYGSGRKVKIFEMLSHGLPVITNVRLEEFGLQNNEHYFYTNNINDCLKKINLVLSNKDLRNKVSNNCYKWSLKNSHYKSAFKKLDFLFN